MELIKYKLTFIVRQNRLKNNGEAPLYVRINVNSDITECNLNFSVAPNMWDRKLQRAKGNSSIAKEVNSHIEMVRNKLYSIYLSLENSNKKVTAENIKKLFISGSIENSVKVTTYICEYVKKVEKLKEITLAPSTIQRYVSFQKILLDFMSTNKLLSLTMDELDGKFTRDFLFYLQTVRRCQHNSAAKYIRSLGKILRDAIKDGDLKKNEADLDLSIKWKETQTEYLTEEELRRIMNLNIPIKRVETVRDIFIFCCFTGLAFIDAKQLTPTHLETDNKGNLWIKKTRQKTNQSAHIPLLEVARNIIEKYSNNPYCMKHNVILPIDSNQKYNAYLKEIADLARIEKNLVSHMARHTFATTVTLANNISMESVSRMLGHSDIKMTKHYAKILDKTIETEMCKIERIWHSDNSPEE